MKLTILLLALFCHPGAFGSEAIVKARRMKAGIGIAAEATKTFGKDADAVKLDSLRGNVKTIMDVLMRTGYGQDKEFEADGAGAAYAQRTGYDPAGLAAVLRKLDASGAPRGGFLKTHPSAGKRAEKLEEQGLEPPAHYRASKARDKRFAASLAAIAG